MMRQWFESLAARERFTLMAGGVVIVLVLGYVVLVEPAVRAHAAQQERVRALEADRAWMIEVAAEVSALGGSRAGLLAGNDTPPHIAMNRALQAAGLAQPERLEAVGEDGVRVEFDAVAFDSLIATLATLRDDSGMRVMRARITRVDAGRVRASLTLERPRP